jgi:hypothetical protein
MPPMPPPTEDERAHDRAMNARLDALIVKLRQNNLDRAVKLAELARQRRLPKELEEHFAELGRRFFDLVDSGGVQKTPSLRVIEGGAE